MSEINWFKEKSTNKFYVFVDGNLDDAMVFPLDKVFKVHCENNVPLHWIAVGLYRLKLEEKNREIECVLNTRSGDSGVHEALLSAVGQSGAEDVQ